MRINIATNSPAMLEAAFAGNTRVRQTALRHDKPRQRSCRGVHSEHYDSIEGQVERSCFAHRDFLAVRFSGFAGARVLSIRPIIEGVQSVADRL
jgi:hypothetical protein